MESKSTIYAALIAAQAEFLPALKDAKNPFFKSNYAPLDSIWKACKDALSKNKLFLSQAIMFHELAGWVVNTKVYNEAGEFIASSTPIMVTKQNDPQAFGSAMTYARRYDLAAILGIITDDDDGEGAMDRVNSNQKQPQNKTVAATAVKVESVTTADALQLATPEQKAKIRALVKNDYINTEEETNAVGMINDNLTFEIASKVIAKLNRIITERTDQAKATANKA